MNATPIVKRSMVGVELVRLLAEQGERVFSTEKARELSVRAGIKPNYLLEALYHLRRNGWIVALRRGFYALASSVPGVAPVHEFEIAMAIVRRAAISHWSALHYHGLTDQVPLKVFVLTTTDTAIPQTRGDQTRHAGGGCQVGETVYQFIRVKPARFFGLEKIWVGDAHVTVTDPERSLLDGLMMPQYCGDFAEVLHAFDVRGDRLDLNRVVNYALKLDGATIKRLGWVLEHQGVDLARLEPLVKAPITGYRSLDPTGPHQGIRNHRWMIQENLHGPVTS